MEFPSSGELNRRITIRDWQDQPNGDAGIDQQFTKPVILWAKHEPVGAGIRQGSAQINELITDRFYVRYRESLRLKLSKDSRFYMRNTEYRVRTCTDLKGARLFLVIECEELGQIRE